MTAHPGRRALLARAAYDLDVGSDERRRIISIACPNADEEHVLSVLRQAREALNSRNGQQASDLILVLIDESEDR